MFGAVGDGVTNDYPALRRMASAVVDHTTVNLRAEAVYRLGGFKDIGGRRVRVTPYGLNGVDDIIIRADDVVINLNGATLRHDRVDRVPYQDTTYSHIATICPLFLDRCNRVRVNGPGSLEGPASTSTKTSGLAEGPCHGACVYGGDDIVFREVTFEGWLADGLWVGAYDEVARDRVTAGRVTTEACLFSHNARQGVSVVGCNDYRDFASTMRDTGNTAYGFHSPGAGVDVEPLPFQSLPTNARFEGTQLINNTGCALVASEVHTPVDLVELTNVKASFDLGTAKNRQVAQSLIGATGNFVVRGATLENIRLRAGDGGVVYATGVVVSNIDPAVGCVEQLETATMTIENSTFSIASRSSMTVVPISMRNGSFSDNTVFIAGSAHDGAVSDLAARFEGTALGRIS